MGLRGLLMATALAFSLVVFMLVAASVIPPLYDMFSGGVVAQQGYSGQLAFTRDAVLVFVPTMFSVGIIVYAYAAIQRSESFFGGGGRPR